MADGIVVRGYALFVANCSICGFRPSYPKILASRALLSCTDVRSVRRHASRISDSNTKFPKWVYRQQCDVHGGTHKRGARTQTRLVGTGQHDMVGAEGRAIEATRAAKDGEPTAAIRLNNLRTAVVQSGAM